jgi:hypothetical protein
MGWRVGSFLVILTTVAGFAWGGTPPPPYAVVLIDYLQSEPLTDAAIYPSVHPATEFTANGAGVGYTVWPRTSGTRQVKIRFLNPTLVAHTATLTVTGASYTTALGTNSLSITPSSNQLSFPSAGEAEQIWTISGLPNYVAKGDLCIQFTLIGIGAGSSLSGGIATTLYQTEATPLGTQNPVWRNVLDDACDWALGEQGVNACRWETTTGLYFAGIFSYFPNDPVYTAIQDASDEEVKKHKYYLRQFFIDRANVPELLGDCQDVSNYLRISWNALGVAGTALQFGAVPNANNPQPPEEYPIIRTQTVAPIGSDPDQVSSYATYLFAMHQTAFVQTELAVFDAALAHIFDPSTLLYYRPAKQWYYHDYFQKAVNPYVVYPGGFSNFTGLAREYKHFPTTFGESVALVTIEVILTGYVDYPTD